MKISEISFIDIVGACAQWTDYVKTTLSYDNDIGVQCGLSNGRLEVWIRAGDAFQKGVHWDRVVGRLSCLQHFTLEDDWEESCKLVWERLKSAMQRDEREIRHAMSSMGSVIEDSTSFTSAVGKLFAERIRTARDEVNQHMIEHRKSA